MDLARMRGEPGWPAAVARETSFWTAKVADVKAAILKNALDDKRPSPDQWFWIKRYQKMMGVDFLHDDESEE